MALASIDIDDPVVTGGNTGDVTLGAFGSAPDAKGASISGQAITIQPADATHPGSVSLSAQTMGAGTKTFSGLIESTIASGSVGLAVKAGAKISLNSDASNTVLDSYSSTTRYWDTPTGSNFIWRVNGSNWFQITGGAHPQAYGDYLTLTGNFTSNNGSPFTASSAVADGAAAVGFATNNTTTFTNATSKLVSIKNNGTEKLSVSKDGRLNLDATDASGTPGAATINKPSGQVSIAAGASSVVVTNSTVSATSVVVAVLQFSDATLTSILRVVPGSGTFTVTGNANATANTKVGFVVFNP